MRRLHLCIGYGSAGLGFLGLVLPLLPTTPFVLLAAWAFARAEPALLMRLEAHPRLGPPLEAWRRERAIPARAKALALAMIAFSLASGLYWAESMALRILLATILSAVALFIVTRPAPRAG